MPKHLQYADDGALLGAVADGEDVSLQDVGGGVETPAETPEEGYGALTKAQLHDELDARGIEYTQRQTNDELVALLEQDDDDNAGNGDGE